MTLANLIPSFLSFQSSTQAALEETKAALALRDKTISDLSAKLEALEASVKAKADDSTDDAPADADDSSVVDKLIADLQKVLDTYKSGEDSDASDDSSDSTEDDSDSTDDSSDDANDETAKASKVEKLKALTKAASKIVAESKAVKASVPAQVIKEIASIGIPTPVATKPDGKPTALKGLDRVAAALTEQLTKK